MPSYLDLALLLIVAVSALLSMVRGFTREVLAIASWGVAAIAAYYLHPYVMPYVTPYIAKESIAQIAAIAGVFFLTLIVVSILTVKLSDAILDSKVGALDRTLGFIFGAARGFLLAVVAFQFYNWLAPKSQPDWIASAKSRPLLKEAGDNLQAMLPVNPEIFIKSLKRDKTAPGEDVAPDSESAPGTDPAAQPKADATPPAPAPAKVTPPAQTDKQKLDSLLGKVGGQPAKKP